MSDLDMPVSQESRFGIGIYGLDNYFRLRV
jgi:hypothetical protein